MRRLTLATCILFLAGCNCGKSTGEETDAGVDGGFVGTDAGTVSTLPFSAWCENVQRGNRNQLLRSARACGQDAITDAELERVGYLLGFPLVQLQLSAADCSGGVLEHMNELFTKSIAAGRMGYDAKRAFDCRQLGRTSDGGVGLELFQANGAILEPCRSVLTGLVPPSGSCDYHEECAGDSFCQPGGALSCGGSCQPRLAVGALCNPHRELCGVDAACGDPGGTGELRCVAAGLRGESCTSSEDCARGLICGLDNLCKEPAAEGQACADITDSDDCADGLDCVQVGAGGLCRPKAGLGDPCGRPVDGAVGCAGCAVCEGGVCVEAVVGTSCVDDSRCPDYSYCASGVCALKPREGEACDTSNESGDPAAALAGNCLYGDNFCKRSTAVATLGVCSLRAGLSEQCGDRYDAARCREGFCQVPPGGEVGLCSAGLGQGAPCPAGNECDANAGLWCDASGTCQPLPGAGQPCAEDECADGHYCNDADLCLAQKEAGAPCVASEECSTGTCDRVDQVCISDCNTNYAVGCGCPVDGARQYSLYLLFALVLLPRAARRRRR